MVTLAETFTPGTVVGERYRVERLIAQGGFGAVFRATQLNLDRPVALKAILPEALGDEGIARFQREAAIVQRLEHPNIVRLLDFGVASTREPFLVFELLEGLNLDEAIRAQGPFPPARVARVGSQVLKALMEAHARGVVHRDIKPANVFLCSYQGEPDFVKLLDFGIARSADMRPVTQAGTILGTPTYMAPEQLQGGEVTFAADLFALGLTLEEALTGEPVYRQSHVLDMLREHSGGGPVPHKESTLRSPLGPVIHRATLKAPEHRYPSAKEMLAHLDAVVDHAMPGAYATARRAIPDVPGAPTALPILRNALVPPLPSEAPPAARERRFPTAILAAVGGAALVLAAVFAVLVVAPMQSDAPRVAASASAARVAPTGAVAVVPGATPEGAPTLEWRRLDQAEILDVDANGDGRPDFFGLCAAEMFQQPTEVCMVDGATLKVLWRTPVGRPMAQILLAATSRAVVAIDEGGVAHLLDRLSGKETASVSLGARAEHACVPAGTPDSVWVRARPKRGLLLDVEAKTTRDAPRPASCPLTRSEFGCDDKNVCGTWFIPEVAGFRYNSTLVEGTRGVAFGEKKTDHDLGMWIGFEATGDPRKPRVLWQRPVGPGDGLGALAGMHANDRALAGGRAITAYQEPTGATHLIAVDAATGRTLWDEKTPAFLGLGASATRVYTTHDRGLDVRDAATGRLLRTLDSGPKRP